MLDEEDSDDYEHDLYSGKKKKGTWRLNKKKLSQFEMDELFLDDEYE